MSWPNSKTILDLEDSALLALLQQGMPPGSIVPRVISDLARALDTRSGLLPPNPGAQRLIGLPSVMASPPTVTQGVANAGTTLAGVTTAATLQVGGVWVPNPLAPWRYLSGGVVVDGQTGAPRLYVSPSTVISYFGGLDSGQLSAEFDFDGASFEFIVQSQPAATQYRIWVNGQLVNAYGTLGPPSGGNQYFILVAFGSRANRRIRIDFSYNSSFGGIAVGPNDTIWTPVYPAGPRAYLIGDSMGGGTGATSSITCFADMMAQALGWNDVFVNGIGGTGYLAVSGQGKKFRDRLATDLFQFAPDIMVITGGANDVGAFTAAQVQAEATLLFAQIRAGLPNVKLIVAGNFKLTGSPDAATVAMRDAIKAAWATDPGPGIFVDPIVATVAGANSLGWFTGTGRVGATTGTGNCDLYLSADAVHPTQVGHDYLGRRMASAIAAQMPF